MEIRVCVGDDCKIINGDDVCGRQEGTGHLTKAGILEIMKRTIGFSLRVNNEAKGEAVRTGPFGSGLIAETNGPFKLTYGNELVTVERLS